MQVLFGALHKTWAAPCLATPHVALRGHLRFMVQSSLDVCQILSLSLCHLQRALCCRICQGEIDTVEREREGRAIAREIENEIEIEMYFYASTNFTQFTRKFIFTTWCSPKMHWVPSYVYVMCVYMCGSGMRTISKPNNSQTFAWFSRLEDAGPKMPERILCKLQTGGEP